MNRGGGLAGEQAEEGRVRGEGGGAGGEAKVTKKGRKGKVKEGRKEGGVREAGLQ